MKHDEIDDNVFLSQGLGGFVRPPHSPGVTVFLEVNLQQPEEGMLRQEEAHAQGQELPALQSVTRTQ